MTGRDDCPICWFGTPEVIAQLREVIWDEGTGERRANWIRLAARVWIAAVPTMPGRGGDRPPLRPENKTWRKHAHHVEAESSGEQPPLDVIYPDYEARRSSQPPPEVILVAPPEELGFEELMGKGMRVGSAMLDTMEAMSDRDRAFLLVTDPKTALAFAKLGLDAAATVQKARQSDRRAAIDVAALFAHSGGFIDGRSIPVDADDEEVTVEDLRAAVHEERRLLEARASTT